MEGFEYKVSQSSHLPRSAMLLGSQQRGTHGQKPSSENTAQSLRPQRMESPWSHKFVEALCRPLLKKKPRPVGEGERCWTIFNTRRPGHPGKQLSCVEDGNLQGFCGITAHITSRITQKRKQRGKCQKDEAVTELYDREWPRDAGPNGISGMAFPP